jgi:hypothetical protein
MLKYFKVMMTCTLLLLLMINSACVSAEKEHENEISVKGGTITQNETWSGEILVNKSIGIPESVTLTIEPGTVVKFKHYRGYKEPWGKIGFLVNGGTIKAIGTPDKPIWFTSDAEDPINGDWGGIELHHTNDSEFKYIILEYAVSSLLQLDSKVNVSHSILRWSTFETLYAVRSQPVFEYNLLYQNGYHDIALEQFNDNVQIRYNIFGGGHVPIIVIDSKANIVGNYFNNYTSPDCPAAISVCGLSEAIIKGNRFENFVADPPILIDPSGSATITDNDYGDGNIPIPTLDYNDIKHHDLGYTPGDSEDKFMYVFAREDETRRVIKRIGKGLGFGWALEYANGYLWKLDTGVLYKIDPETGNYTTLPVDRDDILGPRGLAYDGEFFWAYDHTNLTIVKFRVVDDTVEVLESFDIPEKESGSPHGLATDGTYLYLPGEDGRRVFEINKTGVLVREIALHGVDLAGTFTWTGSYFWSNAGSVWQKWTKEGELVGQIYDVAVGTHGSAWDGKYLWALTSTCEWWPDDPKIFQIEILDDSLELTNPSLE